MKTMNGNIWENLLGTAANDTANKIGNAFGNLLNGMVDKVLPPDGFNDIRKA